MKIDLTPSFRFLSKTLFAAGLALSIVGCEDMVTYSQEAQNKGFSEYNQGQYDLAAGSFQNAVKQNPRDYKSYYWLGVTYDASKNYQQAIPAYRASLDVQQMTLEGRLKTTFRRRTLDGLAIAISKSQGKSDEIQKIIDKSSGHETAEDALLLAKIFRYSYDADSAIDAYNRAVLLDPNDIGITREAGLYFAQIKKDSVAEPLLKRAYIAQPDDTQVADALRGMGIVPGPSLKDEDQLAKPLIPRGPIPEIGLNKDNTPSNAQAQTPRD